MLSRKNLVLLDFDTEKWQNLVTCTVSCHTRNVGGGGGVGTTAYLTPSWGGLRGRQGRHGSHERVGKCPVTPKAPYPGHPGETWNGVRPGEAVAVFTQPSLQALSPS